MDLYLKSLLVCLFFQVYADFNIQYYPTCTTFTLRAFGCILLPLSFTHSVLTCVQHMQPVTHVCESVPAERLGLKSCWRAQKYKPTLLSSSSSSFPLWGWEIPNIFTLQPTSCTRRAPLRHIFAFFMTNTRDDSWKKYKPVMYFQHRSSTSTNDPKQGVISNQM